MRPKKTTLSKMKKMKKTKKKAQTIRTMNLRMNNSMKKKNTWKTHTNQNTNLAPKTNTPITSKNFHPIAHHLLRDRLKLHGRPLLPDNMIPHCLCKTTLRMNTIPTTISNRHPLKMEMTPIPCHNNLPPTSHKTNLPFPKVSTSKLCWPALSLPDPKSLLHLNPAIDLFPYLHLNHTPPQAVYLPLP